MCKWYVYHKKGTQNANKLFYLFSLLVFPSDLSDIFQFSFDLVLKVFIQSNLFNYSRSSNWFCHFSWIAQSLYNKYILHFPQPFFVCSVPFHLALYYSRVSMTYVWANNDHWVKHNIFSCSFRLTFGFGMWNFIIDVMVWDNHIQF